MKKTIKICMLLIISKQAIGMDFESLNGERENPKPEISSREKRPYELINEPELTTEEEERVNRRIEIPRQMLFTFIEQDSSESIDLVVKNFHVELDIIDMKKNSPLAYAIETDKLVAVKKILELALALKVDILDVGVPSPRELAKDRPEMEKLLQEHEKLMQASKTKNLALKPIAPQAEPQKNRNGIGRGRRK